jgi:hypothetical protein
VAAIEADGSCTQFAEGISILCIILCVVLCVVLVIILIVIVIIIVIILIVVLLARQLPAAASIERQRSATPDSGRRVQSAMRVGRAGRARIAQVSSQSASQLAS